MKIIINDTAGQEQFRSLAKFYYQEAKIAVIVYSIISQESFEGVKYWVNELNNQGPKNITIALVGNKQDLLDEEEVRFEESQSYANSIGAYHYLTSAKTNTGVKELFY